MEPGGHDGGLHVSLRRLVRSRAGAASRFCLRGGWWRFGRGRSLSLPDRGCCINPRRARWIASKGGLLKRPSRPSRGGGPSRCRRAQPLWGPLPRARSGFSQAALCNSHGSKAMPSPRRAPRPELPLSQNAVAPRPAVLPAGESARPDGRQHARPWTAPRRHRGNIRGNQRLGRCVHIVRASGPKCPRRTVRTDLAGGPQG